MRRSTPKVAGRSKYNAVPTIVDNVRFASKREAKRYSELKLLKVKALVLQPEYELVVNGVLICKYRADFAYDGEGIKIVEDVKGFKTTAYRLKKKLMKALHNIEIREV